MNGARTSLRQTKVRHRRSHGPRDSAHVSDHDESAADKERATLQRIDCKKLPEKTLQVEYAPRSSHIGSASSSPTRPHRNHQTACIPCILQREMEARARLPRPNPNRTTLRDETIGCFRGAHSPSRFSRDGLTAQPRQFRTAL